MFGSINHIAIAVPDLNEAAVQWATRTGADVSSPQSLPEHGVKVVYLTAENGKIELLEPLDNASPIAEFLKRNPHGGMNIIIGWSVNRVMYTKQATHVCITTASDMATIRRTFDTESTCAGEDVDVCVVSETYTL